MNTKLTLTIDRSVIQDAKKYAKKNRRSLSDLVENYFKILVNEEPTDQEELTPLVRSMKGAFKISRGIDYKKELTSSLSKKYM